MKNKIGLFISCACLMVPQLAFADATIEWRVIDRFRLFEAKPPSAQIIEDTFKSPADIFLDRLETKLNNGANDDAIYEELRDFLLRENDNDDDGQSGQIYKETHYKGMDYNKNKPLLPRQYSKNYLYPEIYNVRAKIHDKRILKDTICIWQFEGAQNPHSKALSCDASVIIPIYVKDGAPQASLISIQAQQNHKPLFAQSFIINIEDKLLLSLGDSYASGEGNPDKPQSFGNKDEEKAEFDKAVAQYFESSSDPYERWWAKHNVTANITPAQWWDGLCHRSLMSQHSFAAMIHAAKNPHQSTTYASFACSGGQILGGILSPQPLPVGQLEIGTPDMPKGVKFQSTPQLGDALALLCNNELEQVKGEIDFADYANRIMQEENIKSSIKNGISQSALKCKGNFKPRKIDALLLSVGGNDAGFVAAIINTLLPQKQNGGPRDSLVNFAKDTFNIEPSYVTERKARFLLPATYNILEKQLKNGLLSKDTIVIQSKYPLSFLDETGRNYCSGPNDNKLFASFNSLYLDENSKASKRWRTEITEEEGRDIRENLFAPLNSLIENNSKKNWRIIGFGNKFDARGWCAGNAKERAEFDLPALDLNNLWTPFDPKDWQPYAARTRLFRGANDAALTQIGSNAGFPIIDKIFDQDRSIFATFGMFHPTAQGHAIMAIEIDKQLERAFK